MQNLKKYREYITVTVLLLLFFILGFTSMLRKSPAFDETVHITGGYVALKENDFRINPENGILPQIWAASPLLFDSQIRGPDKSHRFWKRGLNWDTANKFLFKSGNDFAKMFLLSRIMMLIAGIATGIVVYFASRQLWGKHGAIISLTLFVLSPTVLAHSRFITSDSFSTLFFFLSAWSFHILLKRFSILNILWFSFSVAALFLSKMSAPIIIPILIIMIFIRLYRRKSYKGRYFQKSFILKKQWKQAMTFSCYVIFAGIITYISIWSVFGFRYSMRSDEKKKVHSIFKDDLDKKWDIILKADGIPEKAIFTARKYRLLPEAYIYGFGHVLHESKFRYSFINGHYSSTGWWYFFPLTFIMKTPLPILLLIFLGIINLIFQKKRFRTIINLKRSSYLILLILIYFIFSLTTNLNIGHRHLLVIYPPLFIIAGGAISIARQIKFGKLVIYMLLLILLFENIMIFPHYLTYFSPCFGGASQGYKHLVDSSLDWGQELKGLKTWIKKNKIPDDKVYISYFGSIELEDYGLQHKRLLCYFRQDYPGIFPLQEGTYFISATMLQMVYFPKFAKWSDKHEKLLIECRHFFQKLYSSSLGNDKLYQEMVNKEPFKLWTKPQRNYELLRFAKLAFYLRNKKPDAIIGNSILVFELTNNDIEKMIGKELEK